MSSNTSTLVLIHCMVDILHDGESVVLIPHGILTTSNRHFFVHLALHHLKSMFEAQVNPFLFVKCADEWLLFFVCLNEVQKLYNSTQ